MNLENNFSVQSFLNKFGTLEEMSDRYLLNIISNHSDNERKILLASSEIRDRIIKMASGRNYKTYFWDVSYYLTIEEMLFLFNEETLKDFFKRKEKYKYLFYKVLCERNLNETIKLVLENDDLFANFFKENDKFYSIFFSIDYELLKAVIIKMRSQNFPYPLEFIQSISAENQIKLCNEPFDDQTLVNLVNNFRDEAQQYFFLHHKKAIELFRHFNIKGLIIKGIEFNPEILKNKDFFEMVKDNSLVIFRTYIDGLEKTQDIDIIDSFVNHYYHELLSSYDSESKMFKEYLPLLKNPEAYLGKNYILSNDIYLNVRRKRKEEIEDYLKSATSKKISEIIIDALFKDNIYNIWFNIKEMLRYNSKLSTKVIEEDRVNFYQMVLNIDKLTCEEKIKLYNKFYNKDIASVFYDDLRKSKDISYKKIKDSLFDVNKESTVDEKLTKEYGVKVIDMRDREFYMLIKEQGGYYPTGNAGRSCYSLISNDNTTSYFDGDLICYGYNSFPEDYVMHVCEHDSGSADLKDKAPSNYVNRIMTPDEIVRGDFMHSEIDISNVKDSSGKYIYRKPDYVIAYGDIYNNSLEAAKTLGIPIVIIEYKELDKYKVVEEDFGRHDMYIEEEYAEAISRESR